MQAGLRKWMAGVALSVASVATVPAASWAESLADVLAEAYSHSGLLQQNRALLRAADEDVASTYALLRPIIGYSGGVERSFGRFASASTGGITADSVTDEVFLALSFDLLLFDNGATRSAVEAAKESVLATRQALISSEQSVLLDAVDAFMSVVRDREIVELRINNLRLLERELQAAKDRFEVGEITRTDVALAEARLAGARAELAIAQGNMMQSTEFFASAVGRRPGNLVAPRSTPTIASTLADAKAVAIRSHPEMRKIQHEILASEWNIKRTDAANGPTVRLRGALSVTEDFSEDYFSHGGTIGINVTAPIYQGGRLASLTRQAMAQRDALRAGLHLVRHALRQQTGVAWATLASAQAQLDASDREIEAARIAFEGVREEAKLGSRTTLDVLIAEQSLLDAEAKKITAQAARVVATYGVLSAMGLMTVDHLNLRVERYDPEAYYNMVKDAPAGLSERGKKLDRVLRAMGKE